jgi:hypothetical protein
VTSGARLPLPSDIFKGTCLGSIGGNRVQTTESTSHRGDQGPTHGEDRFRSRWGPDRHGSALILGHLYSRWPGGNELMGLLHPVANLALRAVEFFGLCPTLSPTSPRKVNCEHGETSHASLRRLIAESGYAESETQRDRDDHFRIFAIDTTDKLGECGRCKTSRGCRRHDLFTYFRRAPSGRNHSWLIDKSDQCG